MAVKKGLGKGLGKGLDSMIPDTFSDKVEKKENVEAAGERMLRISQIHPNEEQPRRYFEQDSLMELAESIKRYGVIQPLVVQKNGKFYEIIAGERRWRAAKEAGLKEVPVLVKEYSSQEKVEIALIENIQREDLNPIEEAAAYKRLIDEFELKQDEVSERVAKSRSAITNSLRLLKLSEKVQQMVIEEKLTSGHARTLIPIEDKELQERTACQIFDEKLSVREAEKLVRNLLKNKDKPETKKEEDKIPDAVYQNLEEKMKQVIGSKVNITHKNGKGKIEISYFSQDELDRIYELLMSLRGRE